MNNVEVMEVQAQEYQKIEEFFEDKDSEIFDTIVSVSSVYLLKNNLKVLKDQGTGIHEILCSHFHFFTTEQNLNFPEFVDWCASNNSSSERVIMDVVEYKILFPINSLVIRDKISFPTTFI